MYEMAVCSVCVFVCVFVVVCVFPGSVNIVWVMQHFPPNSHHAPLPCVSSIGCGSSGVECNWLCENLKGFLFLSLMLFLSISLFLLALSPSLSFLHHPLKTTSDRLEGTHALINTAECISKNGDAIRRVLWRSQSVSVFSALCVSGCAGHREK